MKIVRQQSGWLPEPDYIVDKQYAFNLDLQNISFEPIDLRFAGIKVWDQGERSTCTAHALAAGLQIVQYQQGQAVTEPSRLFIHWNALGYTKQQGTDSRVAISVGFDALQEFGCCSELTWPSFERYLRTKPTKSSYDEARKYRTPAGIPLAQDISQLLNHLRNNRPFIFGFYLYDSYLSDDVRATGVVPTPNFQSEDNYDFHAVAAVGYDNGYFIFQNSRGVDWGRDGFGYMSSDLLLNPRFAKNFMGFPSVK